MPKDAYRELTRSLTDEEKARALRQLREQGVVPTKENVAEQAAVGTKPDNAQQNRQNPRNAAYDDLTGKGGPTSAIAKRKQDEMDAARRKGPPADMIRRHQDRYK